jgi:farnesyl diphosphate synthase
MISLMFDTLHSHRRIVQYKTSYYSFYLPVSVTIVYLISLVVMLSSNSILCSYFAKVACALLLSGENLDNFGDVKNILVEMGTYFQVQVNHFFWKRKKYYLILYCL